MILFHDYLFLLIYTSLSISLASAVFAALTVTFSPAVWLIPAVVIMTFVYHIVVLLIVHSETYRSPRIYSTLSVTCAYLLTSLWAAIFVMSVTFTYLVSTKKWATMKNEMHIWIILLSALSFIEIVLMGFIAIRSHKELRQIRYKRKWEWSLGSTAGWRLVHPEN